MDETVNGSVTRTYAYGLQRISGNQQTGPDPLTNTIKK